MYKFIISLLFVFTTTFAAGEYNIPPFWDYVGKYSQSNLHNVATFDPTLIGDLKVTNDGSGHGGDITADTIAVSSILANYLTTILGINTNALTADHTLIKYETIIHGLNVDEVTANSVNVGIVNSTTINNSGTIYSATAEIVYIDGSTIECDLLNAGAVIANTLTGNGDGITGTIAGQIASVYANCIANENLTKGNVVYFVPGAGLNPRVGKADNRYWEKAHPIGFADETKTTNQPIRIVTWGSITGINTSGYTEGDHVYLGPNGTYTETRPTSGAIQVIGYVAYAHAVNGRIQRVMHHESYWGAPEDDPFWFRFGTKDTGLQGLVMRDVSNNDVAYFTDNGDLALNSATAEVGYYVKESAVTTPKTGYGVYHTKNGKPYFVTDTTEYMLAGSGGLSSVTVAGKNGVAKEASEIKFNSANISQPGGAGTTAEVSLYLAVQENGSTKSSTRDVINFKTGAKVTPNGTGVDVEFLGSAGGWTDDGTTVRLTTSTDKVGIGTATMESTKFDVKASGNIFKLGNDTGSNLYYNTNSNSGTLGWNFKGNLDTGGVYGLGSSSEYAGWMYYSTTNGYWEWGGAAAAGNEGGSISFNGRHCVIMDFKTAKFYPDSDNDMYLGYSDRKWHSVWSNNGTIQTSDPNTKDIEAPLTGSSSLLKINNLETFKFTWKADTDKLKAKKHIGLSSENLKQWIPEAVYEGGTDKDGKKIPDGVNYATVIPVLVNAVQEQQRQIEALQLRIEALENK